MKRDWGMVDICCCCGTGCLADGVIGRGLYIDKVYRSMILLLLHLLLLSQTPLLRYLHHLLNLHLCLRLLVS